MDMLAKELRPRPDLHQCFDGNWNRSAMYGGAVGRCVADAHGCFWVENDVYASRVQFCPFCGAAGALRYDRPPWQPRPQAARPNPTPTEGGRECE